MADNSDNGIDAPTENSVTGGDHPSLLVIPHLEMVRQDSNPTPPSPTTGQSPLQYGATHPGVSFEDESCSEYQPTDEPVDKTTLDCSFQNLSRNRELIEGSLQQYELSTKERQTRINSLETELEQKELDYADREHRFVDDIHTLSHRLDNEQTGHRSAVETVDELVESLGKEKRLVDRLIYDQVTLQNEFDTLHSEKTALAMSVQEMIEHINATTRTRSLEKKNQLNDLEKQKELGTIFFSEELERINEAVNAKSEANHSLNTDLEAVEQRCAGLDNQCRGTSEELHDSKTEIVQCQSMAEQILTEKNWIMDQFTKLDIFSKQTVEKLVEREREINALKESHPAVVKGLEDAMSEEVEKNKVEKLQIFSKLSQSKGVCKELNRQLMCLSAEVVKLGKYKVRIDLENTVLNEKLQKQRSDHLESSLLALKKEIDNLSDLQAYQATVINYHEDEMDILRKERTALKVKISRFNFEKEELRLGRQETANKYPKLATSLKNIGENRHSTSTAAMEDEISILNEQVENLNCKNAKSKEELDEWKKECENLELILKRFEQVNSQNSELQTKKVDKLEREKEELAEKNRILTAAIADLKREQETLKDQLNELAEFQDHSSETSVYVTNAANLNARCVCGHCLVGEVRL